MRKASLLDLPQWNVADGRTPRPQRRAG
jgi:hypothetical protein